MQCYIVSFQGHAERHGLGTRLSLSIYNYITYISYIVQYCFFVCSEQMGCWAREGAQGPPSSLQQPQSRAHPPASRPAAVLGEHRRRALRGQTGCHDTPAQRGQNVHWQTIAGRGHSSLVYKDVTVYYIYIPSCDFRSCIAYYLPLSCNNYILICTLSNVLHEIIIML